MASWLLADRDGARLETWLNAVGQCELPTIRGIAKVFRGDLAAVQVGITTAYNSGVNEGWITDLKLLKRQMGGRAGIALLRRRVMLVAHSRRASTGSWSAIPS